MNIIGNEELNNFLSGDKIMTHFNKGNGQMLVKIDSGYKNERFQYIFFGNHAKEVLPFLNLQASPIGIYDKESNQFYFEASSYDLNVYLKKVDLQNYVCFSDIVVEVNEKFEQHVITFLRKKMETPEGVYDDPIKFSDYEISTIENQVEVREISGEPMKFYSIQLPDFEYNMNLYFEYLEHGDRSVKERASEYLTQNFESLKKCFYREKYATDYRKSLESNYDFQSKKRMFKALGSKKMKTINLLYCDGNRQMTIKVENCLIQSQNNLATWHIVDTKSRSKFETQFGNRIEFKNIEAIVYGRKTLFTR